MLIKFMMGHTGCPCISGVCSIDPENTWNNWAKAHGKASRDIWLNLLSTTFLLITKVLGFLFIICLLIRNNFNRKAYKSMKNKTETARYCGCSPKEQMQIPVFFPNRAVRPGLFCIQKIKLIFCPTRSQIQALAQVLPLASREGWGHISWGAANRILKLFFCTLVLLFWFKTTLWFPDFEYCLETSFQRGRLWIE